MLAFRARPPVLRRVVLHDDYLEVRRLLRVSRRIPWRDVRGVRIASNDPAAVGPWENSPVRFRAVQVKVDGVWTRLGALTAWRWDLLDTDPPGWMRRGYTEVRGFWERGGGRTDDDDDGWLNA